MNLRSWFLVGYSLVFFFGGYWVFQLTSLFQFALILIGYIGLAFGCLWWWTIHAENGNLGAEDDGTVPTSNRRELFTTRQPKPRQSTTIRHVSRPTRP